MKTERKIILEKIGMAMIIAFFVYIFLASIKFNEKSNSFLIFRSMLGPVHIFIGFSCLFGIHILDFFKDLIKGLKKIKIKELILFLKYVFIYQGFMLLTTNLNDYQNLNVNGFIDFYISVTMILFVLAEEYIFRYIVQKKLMDVCDDYGILFMAIVFGFFHYGRFKQGFTFGIGIGFIYALTEKNIAYTFLIHYFLNMLLSVKIIVFFQNIFMNTSLVANEANKTTGVISILVGVILILIQLLLKSNIYLSITRREKEILKKLINQIKYLPELVTTFPINLTLFIRIFIYIQKIIW